MAHCDISEDMNLQQHCCENLTSQITDKSLTIFEACYSILVHMVIESSVSMNV